MFSKKAVCMCVWVQHIWLGECFLIQTPLTKLDVFRFKQVQAVKKKKKQISKIITFKNIPYLPGCSVSAIKHIKGDKNKDRKFSFASIRQSKRAVTHMLFVQIKKHPLFLTTHNKSGC